MVATIENSTLQRLAADPAARARLPGLLNAVWAAMQAAGGAGGCGACRSRANAALQDATALARRAIPAMSAGDREALKGLLGATAARVYITQPGTGGITPFDF